MRALVFDQQLRLDTSYPEPTPAAGEAVIRVTISGICNTDIEITKGYMGFRGVLGHEFVGVVEQAEDADWVGRRVVGEINCHCGRCETCRAGLPRHCPHRTVLGISGRDGAFAERLCLPVANLHEVPESVSDEDAVFVEPLAAGFEILEQVRIGPGQSVAVLGDGKLGLLVAQVLAGTGCELAAIGKHASKLALLRGRGIGAALVADAPAGPFDVVVECTGAAAGLEAALRMLRPRGTLVLKSTVAAGAAPNLAPVVIDEITVVGSRCGPFAPAIAALRQRQVSVRELITARYPLAEAPRAFEHAREKRAVKVLLEM